MNWTQIAAASGKASAEWIGWSTTGDDQRVYLATLLVLVGLGMGIFVMIALLLSGHLNKRDWRAGLARLRCRPWEAMDLIFAFVLLFWLFGFGSILSSYLEGHISDESSLKEALPLLCSGVSFHLLGLVALCVALRQKGYSFELAFGRATGRSRHLFGKAVVYLAGWMPLAVLVTVIYRYILDICGVDLLPQDTMLQLTGDYALPVRMFMLLIAVVLAPLFEELLFRGVFLPWTVRKFGAFWGIFIVSMLFAAIHQHVPSMVPLFMLAVGLSLAYIYSGSIWVPILMHSMFNATNVFIALMLKG